MSNIRTLLATVLCAVTTVAVNAQVPQILDPYEKISDDGRPRKILLIPVDDRPAVSQFAQMIGSMADVEVETPPEGFLGKFLTPGSPDSILLWMKNKDLAEYDAVIVNADMVAYGGLIASRVDRSSYNLASDRLRELWRIRKTCPDVPFYVFSALMRIAPTATDETRAYRTELYYWAIAQEKYRQEKRPETLKAIQRYEKKIPSDKLKSYIATRQRNVQIQQDLVRMTYHGAFDHLVFGQDDATPQGPQVPEIAAINKEITRLNVNQKVRYCSGIDQISNNLVSLVLSDLTKYKPTIRVAFADDQGRKKVAAYETNSIEVSLRDQIATSGGKLEKPGDPYDYTLYVNTPDPNPNAFEDFLTNLKLEADQGFPVAVADANLGWTGTADPNLFAAITDNQRVPKLLGYAGWNTAGNTMGTTIPAANTYLLARHIGVDPYKREVALRTFMLHRLVNDYYYHRYVRPEAYKLVESLQNGIRDQVFNDEHLVRVNLFVRDRMLQHLQTTFDEQIKGRPFTIGTTVYRAVGLKNVTVKLPWPRVYEVFIDFELDIQPAQ